MMLQSCDFTTILVLDDDPIMLRFIERELSTQHYRVLSTSRFDDAVQILGKEMIDGVIVDLVLGDAVHDGSDFLKIVKERSPELPVLVASSKKDVSTVVSCMKRGAEDYLDKPFDSETLRLRVDKVFASAKRTRVLQRAFAKASEQTRIIGASAAIERAKQIIEKAHGMRLLIVGETGVGKTPFALYSNRLLSDRTGTPRPFEQINCACLQRERFQDELFGHKKGAYTGAISDKQGLVDIARGGDLFLDEIGDMPLETQANLLTFLDTMEYYRLGDDKKRKADVRIISATNRDLKQMVRDGRFRQDLYSRIAQVIVPIPPLRERLIDIPELARHFVRQFSGYDKPFETEVLDVFAKFGWEEGNIRELRDAVEYGCTMSRNSDRIRVEHLSERYRPIQADVHPVSRTGFDDRSVVYSHGLEHYLSCLEKTVLENLTRENEGSLEGLAEKLKVSRPTLYRRLKKYDLLSH